MPDPVLDRLAALRALDPDGLARLLRDVPWLAEAVEGRGPLTRSWPWSLVPARRLDLRGLAALVADPRGIDVTLASLDGSARALAELASWYGGTISRDQALAEAGPNCADDLDHAAQTLQARLLSDPAAGWAALRPGVAEVLAPPGVSAEPSLRALPSDVLADKLRALGHSPPPRKDERVRELVAALRDPATVERVVASLPADAATAFALLVAHGPQRVADLGVPYWPSYGRPRGGEGLGELIDRGLVGIDLHEQVGLVWLDVLVGLRGGRLLGDAFPRRQFPRMVPLAGGVVALPPVVEHLDAVLAHFGARPAEALASGGLGVRPIREAGKALGLPRPEVGLLAHLAAELGLLGVANLGSSGRGRDRRTLRRWAPTALADQWREEAAAGRWARLVQAWREGAHLDEAEGLPERREAQLSGYPGITAVVARSAWIGLLADLPEGVGLVEEHLPSYAGWRFPALLGRRSLDGLVAAARVLGLVPREGAVGLTAAARGLLAGPEALAALLPEPATDVIVQADGTVIAPPDAAPEVTGALARWAELESAAGARVYRLSERRLASALDGGDDADQVLAWLTEHSRVEVPQNVSYLVRDVARRSGRLRAGAARTYLRCDDPSLLSQAVAVKAAKLRTLAPTVAVSPLSRERLLDALAGRGVSAVAEDASGATVTATMAAEPVNAFGRGRSGLPHLRTPPDLRAEAQRLLAAAPVEDEEEDVIERLKRRSRAHALQERLGMGGDPLPGLGEESGEAW